MSNSAETIIDINDAVFGPLHNNYDKEDLYIKGKKYKSVSNYIFSHLTPSSGLKNSMRQSPVSLLYKAYTEDYKTYQLTEAFNYLKIAANQLYETNKDLVNLLLSTGDDILVYDNKKNSFLGTGADGTGKNLYGNYLMSLRTMIREQTQGKEVNEARYKAYLVLVFLTRTITSSDPSRRNDLELMQNQKVSKLLSDYGSIIPVKINAEEFKDVYGFLDQEEKQLLDQELAVPGTMVKYLRHKHIKTYNEITKKLNREEILKNYFRQIIGKKFSSEVKDVEAQVARQISLLSPEQYRDLLDRVNNLYDKGVLKFGDLDSFIITPYSDSEIQSIIAEYKPEKSSQKMKEEEKVEVTNIPPLFEDPFAISIDFSDNKVNVSSQKPLPSFKGYDQQVGVIKFNDKTPKYNVFSPYFYNGLIKIDGYNFYSLHSYIVFELFKNFCDMTSQQAYSLLFKKYSEDVVMDPSNYKSVDMMNQDFRSCEKKTIERNKTDLLSEALTAKFEDLNMKQLLVSTGQKLIYKDNDQFFGTGADNKGTNFMGTLLTALKNQFKSQGIKEKEIETKVQTFSSLVAGNKILSNWINGKLEDFIRSVNIVSNLLEDSVKIDKYFIIFVMKNLYVDCFNYLSAKYKRFDKCPEDFKDKITSLLKEEKTTDLVLLGDEEEEDEEHLNVLEEAGLIQETKKGGESKRDIRKKGSKVKELGDVKEIYIDDSVTSYDVIWTYIFGITRLLLEQVVKSDNPSEERMEDIIKLLSHYTIKQELDCDGSLSTLHNCVVNFIKRLSILMKNYATKSGVSIDTNSYEFTKTSLSLLLPKTVSIDDILEGIDDFPMSVEDMSKMELMSLTLVGEVEINKSIKAIYYFVKAVLDYPDKKEILKIKSRILGLSSK